MSEQTAEEQVTLGAQVPQSLRDRVDAWGAAQVGGLTRSQAIRELLERALAAEVGTSRRAAKASAR
jgi:hypothetical protein